MAGIGSTTSLETVKSNLRSIEEPRAEGYSGSQEGSKILNTPDAVYKKGSKK